MKKNLLKVAFVAVIALVSGINVFNAQKLAALPDIALANVEALANDIEKKEKYQFVYYKEPGDPGYPETRCVCITKNENGVPCC